MWYTGAFRGVGAFPATLQYSPFSTMQTFIAFDSIIKLLWYVKMRS